MKYFLPIFVTAVLVFLGATIYYKGLPTFPQYSKTSVSTQSGVPQIETSPTPIADEKPEIISAVRAGLVIEHGSDAESLDISVSKIEGNFAQGAASEQDGGGMWYAAKVGESWKLVWDGNGQIDCTSISSFPLFPKDMIPECWDTTTNKLITR